MDEHLFNEFLTGNDTLQVYKGDKLIFRSNKEHLLPLLDYIDKFVPYQKGVRIFDKIMGNAAALLSIKAACREVYSPLGSELAIKTLSDNNIEYHLTKIIPYIQNRSGEDMCPMEKLSINKSPEEFYEAIKHLTTKS